MEFNSAHHDAMIAPCAGVPEAVAALRGNGVRLGVVTSKRRALAARGLDVTGLAALFDVLVAEEDSSAHKPHPAPLLEAARRFGVPPEACVYFGDSHFDIQAARAAGMRSGAVAWSALDHAAIRAERPMWWVEEPAALPALIL